MSKQDAGAADPVLESIDRRRAPSGERARRRVMEAAIEAIAEVGADRVRMTDIAVRAGMSNGHILYHFGRKDRLLMETLSWSEGDLTKRLRIELRRLRSPRQKLRRFIEAYLPTGTEDQRWKLWAQLMARPPEDKHSRGLQDSFDREWQELLLEIVRGGTQAGVFTPVDEEAFVLRSQIMLDGLSVHVLVGSLRLTRGAASRFAAEAMERELGAVISAVGVKRLRA